LRENNLCDRPTSGVVCPQVGTNYPRGYLWCKIEIDPKSKNGDGLYKIESKETEMIPVVSGEPDFRTR
jgi:hypothetical protein